MKAMKAVPKTKVQVAMAEAKQGEGGEDCKKRQAQELGGKPPWGGPHIEQPRTIKKARVLAINHQKYVAKLAVAGALEEVPLVPGLNGFAQARVGDELVTTIVPKEVIPTSAWPQWFSSIDAEQPPISTKEALSPHTPPQPQYEPPIPALGAPTPPSYQSVST